MSLSDDKERESLLSACPVPLKCLAYVVDCLWQVWLPFSETSRSPGLVASESDPVLDTGVSRALEEDSSAMMSDTSVLDRVLADLELEAGPDCNAKAVKDDKAKAPTYMWDK